MAKNSIPTAAHRTFKDADAATAYLEEINAPVFIKADGLAAGKGVIPGLTLDAAVGKRFRKSWSIGTFIGSAGDKVVALRKRYLAKKPVSPSLTDGVFCLEDCTLCEFARSQNVIGW